MKNLAVIAPNLGARSETFIQRHMQDLLPDRTVVVAITDKPPYGGHWKINCPFFLIEDFNRNFHNPEKIKKSLKKQLYQAALYKLGLYQPVAPAKKITLSETIENFLIEHNVGVILCEYLDFSLDYISIAHKLNIPLFAHAHGYDVSLRLKSEEWREKYLALNEVNGIIMMNEYSKKVLKDIGIKEEKLYTVPYGVHIPELNSLTVKKDTEVKCLAVGRMVSKKAPILLLDSFRRAAEVHPGLRLDYIGTGDLLPAVRQYIQAFNLEEKVFLHGGLDNKTVLSFMQRADIFIQHSITCPDTGDQEGFPVAILEAMACSLPVISTIHSGIPEAVIDRQTGLLVPEGDSALMAEKILKLATDTKLRQQMGKAGKKRVEIYFSWQRERKLLLELLMIT